MQEADCGVCSKIGDAESLAQAIDELLKKEDIKSLGVNAKFYFDKHFNKELLMDEMDEYLMCD